MDAYPKNLLITSSFNIIQDKKKIKRSLYHLSWNVHYPLCCCYKNGIAAGGRVSRQGDDSSSSSSFLLLPNGAVDVYLLPSRQGPLITDAILQLLHI